MLCTSCGKDNAAAISFCEFCGLDLRKAVPAGASTHVFAAPDAAAAAAVIAQAGKTLVKSLTLGEKFSAAGAAAAIIGFFLPFVSSPNLGSLSDLLGGMSAGAAALAHASYSLLDFSKLLGAIYFILLAAIASAVLFWISRQAPLSRKLLISGFQVMIGSLLGPGCIVALFFVPFIQSIAGLGYWLTGLGFCAIVAGGLITIAELARSTR